MQTRNELSLDKLLSIKQAVLVITVPRDKKVKR